MGGGFPVENKEKGKEVGRVGGGVGTGKGTGKSMRKLCRNHPLANYPLSDFGPSGESVSESGSLMEKSHSESLLPEGQKSFLSHFWGHFNSLGALGGSRGHGASQFLACTFLIFFQFGDPNPETCGAPILPLRPPPPPFPSLPLPSPR